MDMLFVHLGLKQGDATERRESEASGEIERASRTKSI